MILLKNEIAKYQRINFQSQLNEFFEKFQKKYTDKFVGLLDELSDQLTKGEVELSLALGQITPVFEERLNLVLYKFADENLGELCNVALDTVLQDLDKRVPDLDISTISMEDIEMSIHDTFVEYMSEQQMKAINEAIQYCNSNPKIDRIPQSELAEIIRDGSSLNSVFLKASINYFVAQTDSSTTHKAKMRTKKVIEAKKQYRAQVLATDEILWNYRNAEKEAVKSGLEQGVFHGMVKRWMTCGDNRVCPICHELDKTVVDFNESFDLEDGTIISDTNGAHSLCRCGIQYIERELYELGIY